MARPPDNTLPAGLPDIFRWSDARQLGITDTRLARLETDGVVEKLGHGLYVKSETIAEDLEIVFRKVGKNATLCLASALAHADLIDQIPARIHIALPRGTHQPWTTLPIRWHSFGVDKFEIGRISQSTAEGLGIAVYSPERSICDAYRIRYTQGDLGPEALRSWIRKPSSQPSKLLVVAQHFPRAANAIRRDLEILL